MLKVYLGINFSFITKGDNMHIILLFAVIYIGIAEWRIADLRKKLKGYRQLSIKLDKDQSVWYSGVLPKAEALCLFQETNGTYLLSKLSDKHWLKKDGQVDFEKIKRWAYVDDLDKI